jgi:OmpA-OmpF porin, OOP family
VVSAENPIPKPPAAGDSDSDGVSDDKDLCRKTKGPSENKGCPLYKEVVVTTTNIETKQKVFFAFNRATIMPKSQPLLQEVAKAIRDYQLCIRVEGHTDNAGKSSDNSVLSQDRAAEIKSFLVDEGIAENRLSSKGYGSLLPIADNATPDGREANRRIEFVVVECAKGVTP